MLLLLKSLVLLNLLGLVQRQLEFLLQLINLLAELEPLPLSRLLQIGMFPLKLAYFSFLLVVDLTVHDSRL